MADPTPELLIQEFLNEAGREKLGTARQFHSGFKAEQTESGRKILALPRQQQIPVLLYAVAYQVGLIQGRTPPRSLLGIALHVLTGATPTMASLELTSLIGAILRKELPFTENDLCQLTGSMARIT